MPNIAPSPEGGQLICGSFCIHLSPCPKNTLIGSAVFVWLAAVSNEQTDVAVRMLIYIHTHTRLTALFPGQPRWAATRKVKPIWILLKQKTVSGSGISWTICKSAPRSRQITTPANINTKHKTNFRSFSTITAADDITMSSNCHASRQQQQQQQAAKIN